MESDVFSPGIETRRFPRKGSTIAVGTRVAVRSPENSIFLPGRYNCVIGASAISHTRLYEICLETPIGGGTVSIVTAPWDHIVGPGFLNFSDVERIPSGQPVYVTYQGREVRGEVLLRCPNSKEVIIRITSLEVEIRRRLDEVRVLDTRPKSRGTAFKPQIGPESPAAGPISPDSSNFDPQSIENRLHTPTSHVIEVPGSRSNGKEGEGCEMSGYHDYRMDECLAAMALTSLSSSPIFKMDTGDFAGVNRLQSSSSPQMPGSGVERWTPESPISPSSHPVQSTRPQMFLYSTSTESGRQELTSSDEFVRQEQTGWRRFSSPAVGLRCQLTPDSPGSSVTRGDNFSPVAYRNLTSFHHRPTSENHSPARSPLSPPEPGLSMPPQRGSNFALTLASPSSSYHTPASPQTPEQNSPSPVSTGSSQMSPVPPGQYPSPSHSSLGKRFPISPVKTGYFPSKLAPGGFSRSPTVDEGIDMSEGHHTSGDDLEPLPRKRRNSVKTLFKCTWPGCSKTLNTSAGIERHIRREHLGPKEDSDMSDHEEEFYYTEIELKQGTDLSIILSPTQSPASGQGLSSCQQGSTPGVNRSRPIPIQPNGSQPRPQSSGSTSAPTTGTRRARREARKCRKVYGMDNRDLWCTQCRWKKACTRFHE